MATIVVCPKCYKPVAAPQVGGPTSLVRCPLCRDKFPLRQARGFSPPALTLLSESISDVPFGVDADSPTSPAESSSPEPTEASGRGESMAADWLPPAAHGQPAQDAITLETPAARPTRRAASRSLMGEVAKVVLGGIGGLLIGYIVLIWGFHIDPFGLTKALPNFVLPEGLKHP